MARVNIADSMTVEQTWGVNSCVQFLLTAATALSALLALAMAALWVRSYGLYDSSGVQLGRPYLGTVTNCGGRPTDWSSYP